MHQPNDIRGHTRDPLGLILMLEITLPCVQVSLSYHRVIEPRCTLRKVLSPVRDVLKRRLSDTVSSSRGSNSLYHRNKLSHIKKAIEFQDLMFNSIVHRNQSRLP